MNVLVDDRAVTNDSRMNMVYVKFGASRDLMQNTTARRMAIPLSWNAEILELARAKPSQTESLKQPYLLSSVSP